jgi:hypothetical protein
VVFHLTYPKKEVPLQFYALDRFNLLDEGQVAAVAAFLEYVVAHAPAEAGIREDARTALKRYWGLPRDQRPNPYEAPACQGVNGSLREPWRLARFFSTVSSRVALA